MTAILINSQQLDIGLFKKVPGTLQALIEQVYDKHYCELYEERPTSKISLTDVLARVIKMLGECSHNPQLSYFCLAIILGLAVQPTVRCHLPDDHVTQFFFQSLFQNLLEQKQPLHFRENYQSIWGHNQALDEALLVLEGALQVGDRLQAPNQLLDMSELCLEGYAIFPGSAERRTLFDWWLLEAIPAACLQVFPSHIYTLKGLRRREESLEQLRSYFWTVVRQEREAGIHLNGSMESLLGFMAG